MRQVKSSRNKSTEIKLVQYLRKNHIIGWRRNYKLIGKPDFVFPKSNIVVFVDGCFWHGHNCRNTKPKNNKKYWVAKINQNRKRDKKVSLDLVNMGWSVIRYWECELMDEKKIINKLKKQIQ